MIDPLKDRETKELGCCWKKSSLTFGCARLKLMTHYVHTGTVCDWAVRQASRYNRENEVVLLCWHTYVNSFGRQQYLPDVMDYLPVWSITGKSNYLISADRPWKVRQWRDITGLPTCNGLDTISSGGMSTRTGFRSVAKPDLHSAILVVKRTNKFVTCWKGIDLVGAVSWFGKMGDQKMYFVVTQDNFNALYRRRLVTSSHTISPLFLHIKNWSDIWNKLKQSKKNIECNVFFFFVLSFLKGVNNLSWKEINAMCR